MTVLEDGHMYALQSLDGKRDNTLTFVKREGVKYPGNNCTHSGTISQEVLRALINRARYINWQIPCWQTRLSIFLMRLCIWLYEQRAAKRHGVPCPTLEQVEFGVPCAKCGHVRCADVFKMEGTADG